MSGLTVLTPLRMEAAAVRRGAPGATVVRTGMGGRAARRAEAIPASGELDGADELTDRIRERGLWVRQGAILTSSRVLTRAARADAAAGGALAVDLESALLAPAAGGRPLGVVRAVLDTPSHELANPLATARGTVVALRSLRRAAAALEDWAAGQALVSDRESHQAVTPCPYA
jgi:4-hydroxy-3-methylbut-2-enyl diphosphate reductase